MRTSVLTTYMSAHHVCVHSDQGPKEGMESTETRVTVAVSCHVGTGDRAGSLFLLLRQGFMLAQAGSLTSILPSFPSVPFLSQPCLSYCKDSGFQSRES